MSIEQKPTSAEVEAMARYAEGRGEIEEALMLRRLHEWALSAERLVEELQGLLVTHEICADRIKAAARADALEEAQRICDKHAQFAAQGGPHTCDSTNGALWYGREQYARQCANEIGALIPPTSPMRQSGGDEDEG